MTEQRVDNNDVEENHDAAVKKLLTKTYTPRFHNIDDEVKKFFTKKHLPKHIKCLKGDPSYKKLKKYCNFKNKRFKYRNSKVIRDKININWEDVKFTIEPKYESRPIVEYGCRAIFKNNIDNTGVAAESQTHILKFGSASSTSTSFTLVKAETSTGSVSLIAGKRGIVQCLVKGQHSKQESKTDSSGTENEDAWSAESQIVVKGSTVCEVQHVIEKRQYDGAFDICMEGDIHLYVEHCSFQLTVRDALIGLNDEKDDDINCIQNSNNLFLCTGNKNERCEDYKNYMEYGEEGVKITEFGQFVYDVHHEIIANYYTPTEWKEKIRSKTGAGGKSDVTGAGGTSDATGAGGTPDARGAGGKSDARGAGGTSDARGAGGKSDATGAGGRSDTTGAGRNIRYDRDKRNKKE